MVKFIGRLALILVLLVPGLVLAATPEESLKSAFPNVEFEKMNKTPIEGVYEVITPRGILYYAPKAQCIIAGEIITKQGVNLTQAKELELLAARAKDVPLDKALKIGSGKNTIVEFTDIDCQYCRAASQFLAKEKNITRYIFFVSLTGNPQTLTKTKYVLGAPDRARAYEDAMTGKLDDMKFSAANSPDEEKLLQVHKAIGQKVNPPGTPFFLVNGKPVMGANMPEIKSLLQENQK